MFNILNELRSMIKMEGGNADDIHDIGIAVVTLKKLIINNKNHAYRKDFNNQPRREARENNKPEE